MTIDSTNRAHSASSQEASVAMHAITQEAKAENLAVVAALSDAANDTHIAEHIKGMVAATMGHLSADAPATTRASAEQWQEWALGVAAGVAQTVPATV